jgi:RNA polymerase sigma-70 factor (ECF subfamily)
MLMERPQLIDNVQDIKRYVFGILKNKITDRLRQKYRTTKYEVAIETDDIDHVLFDDKGHWVKELAPAYWSTPEEQLNTDQFFAVVDACVHDLPKKIAQVFSMKELLECETQEICDILNLSQADYWQCMSRARKKLQLCLNIRWFEKDEL